jgi:hypothetical protein
MNFKILFLLVSFTLHSQTRVISGKVIGQDLIELPAIKIFDESNELIGETDFNGNFKLEIKTPIKKILFSGIGYQTETLEIIDNCDYIQIIVLYDWIIDFVSLKKAERIIKRDRKKLLPKLYAEAFRKEIFDISKDCWVNKNY